MTDLPSSKPLLSVKDLSVAFLQDGEQKLAVDRISFDLKKGETLALVGESGSGKSVSALSILKLLPYPAASHPSGHVWFDGQDLLNANDKILRSVRGNRISMIFQEPMSSLNPLHTVEQQIGEVLSIHKGMSDKQARERVLQLLNDVGIREPEKRLKSYPHQLSGGQRQRVMIAMALANEPELLIADEPTTALDVTVQAQILELLRELQKTHGMALLFITHDLGIVEKLADKVCVMTNGEIVEKGPTKEIFANPKHSYTQHLLSSEPSGRAHPVADDAPILLTTDELKVWFPIKRGFLRKTVGHIKAVDGISLEIRKGETLGIVGESGSGKTTLGLALLRMISSEGPIVFQGSKLDGLDNKAMRDKRGDMQIVFQDPFGSLSPRMSIEQIVAEGLSIHAPNLSNEERDAKVVNVLKEVGIDPNTRHRYPHEFSGGQRQRISIARAMVLEPSFVMLDEPTSALDMSVQAQVVDLLRDLQARHGLTYLFISHDLKVVRALSNRVLVMRQGKIVEQGDVEQIFDAPETDYTRALMAAALRMETAPEGVVSD
ncbi:ABC transporter ATP-binding protein [uncultured Cohaesibacter sp.]|uniref:ABC transporter ATP-binding protein n=1 Tax=uncultured Cohaesibacter sp. TaxID=1002546 RepID=UPI0029C8EDC8|nr:ABC transporter ATP-binding protein [uncultured Cohaesibacter sp.]